MVDRALKYFNRGEKVEGKTRTCEAEIEMVELTETSSRLQLRHPCPYWLA
jgi:hypothetical protein